MLLPFPGPAIGPQSIEEIVIFQQLTELRRNAGITCAFSVNRGALCGLQRNLI